MILLRPFYGYLVAIKKDETFQNILQISTQAIWNMFPHINVFLLGNDKQEFLAHKSFCFWRHNSI